MGYQLLDLLVVSDLLLLMVGERNFQPKHEESTGGFAEWPHLLSPLLFYFILFQWQIQAGSCPGNWTSIKHAAGWYYVFCHFVHLISKLLRMQVKFSLPRELLQKRKMNQVMTQ
jgi:hypothetical protein